MTDPASRPLAALPVGPASEQPAPTHLLYLHGFRSSPASQKAQRVQAWVSRHRPDLHWWCPQLPPSPAAAWALLAQGLAGWPGVPGHWPASAVSGPAMAAASAHAASLPGPPVAPNAQIAVIGSSLGGFYATRVAEATGCRAVLLNPAVDPARDLLKHLGQQTHWHDPGLSFTFSHQHIRELQALTPPAITRPERYAAVIAQGDEVLDWREMTGRYPGARIRLLAGGDHALSDFDDHLPFVLKSLSLCD